MDTLIQKIIAEDLAARKKCEKVAEEKKHVKNEAEAQKEEIFAEFQKKAEARLAALQQQNEQALADAKAQKTQEYEIASAKLHKTFMEQEETWVEDLFHRCIHG